MKLAAVLRRFYSAPPEFYGASPDGATLALFRQLFN
jgi:hypothetical protein